DVVQREADGDVPEPVAVSDLRLGGVAREDLRADAQPHRSEDVALLAVGVVQERDAGAAVRIVFDRHDAGRDAVLLATEVDATVLALVSAAPEPGGGVAVVVPPARLLHR